LSRIPNEGGNEEEGNDDRGIEKEPKRGGTRSGRDRFKLKGGGTLGRSGKPVKKAQNLFLDRHRRAREKRDATVHTRGEKLKSHEISPTKETNPQAPHVGGGPAREGVPYRF